jgi:hypothetical protein
MGINNGRVAKGPRTGRGSTFATSPEYGPDREAELGPLAGIIRED